MSATTIDLQIARHTMHDSIVLVTPATQAAIDWIEENVSVPEWGWIGSSLAVEHRYVGTLLSGAIMDGLTVGFDTVVPAKKEDA